MSSSIDPLGAAAGDPSASRVGGLPGESGEAPDVSDLIVELLTRTEDDASSQPGVLEELCRTWPSQAAALRTAAGNLDAAGWLDVPQLPEHVGEFKPVARLGGGGMGVVLLAEQPGLERQVAIKLLRSDELLREGAVKRFYRETAAIARLSHPNIVAVHSVGRDHGIPFLVMDYIQGASIDRVIAAQRGRAPEALSGDDVRDSIAAELAGMGVATDPDAPASLDAGLFDGSWNDAALRIARDVASALAHAHARGVLHRDVKPSNIMLTMEGRVQLVDFGLATILDTDRLTRSGSLVGSLPYMAPEELEKGAAPTASTDVYALGVTLYELLILDLPFPGRGTARLRKDVEEGRFVRARALNPSVGSDLEAVLGMACHRDASRRYASASALAADLTALLEGRPVTARHPGAWDRLKGWANRRPELAALVGVVGAVAIGAPTIYGYVNGVHADEVLEINGQLRVALDEQGEARALADRHFTQAIGALDRVAKRMAKDGLEDEPRLQRARLEIVDDALRILGELKEDRPGDPDVIDTDANFLMARGEVLLDLGEVDEGKKALEGHLEIRRGLSAAHPASVERSCELAVAEAKLAWAHSHRKSETQALGLYRQAIERLSEASEASPDDRNTALLLNETRASLAAALVNRGRVEECEGVIEESLALAHSTAQASPDEDSHSRVLGRLYQSLGKVRTEQGQHGEAERAFGQSADAMREALRLKPGHRSHQSLVVLAEMNRAEALSRLSRPDEALECLGAALKENEDMRRRFPSVSKYVERYVGLLNAASFAESMAHRYLRAVELGEKAVEVKRASIASRGGNVAALDGLNLAVNRANLSGRIFHCVELGEGRFARARDQAEGALALLKEHDPELRRARAVARVARYNLVLCATGTQDLSGSLAAMEHLLAVTAERPTELAELGDAWSEVHALQRRLDVAGEELERSYGAALSALERAVQAGYTRRKSLAENANWDPFRADPRFVLLLKSLVPDE